MRRDWLGQLTIAALALLAAAFVPLGSAQARTYKVLYSFCPEQNCADGALPSGPLIADSAGNLFGTTLEGGLHDAGTLYVLLPRRGGYEEHTLYSFCSKSSCADGWTPESTLLLDSSGNLYGETVSGGSYNFGVVFEFVPNARRTTGTLRVLHNFCRETNCLDGGNPGDALTYVGASSGLPYDGVSPLFGLTGYGGRYAAGVAYRLDLDSQHRHGKETALHHFCNPAKCDDGYQPAALIADASGNLFGITTLGGAHEGGVLFELSPNGTGYKMALLHSFCRKQNCVDGSGPAGSLVFDRNGNLMGTTAAGGGEDYGTIYRLNPDGKHSGVRVLYDFCRGCPDGDTPEGGVVMAKEGDFLASTSFGGEPSCDGGRGCGTVVELNGGTLSVLHTFCPDGVTCADGRFPNRPYLDGSGNVLGTTQGGGQYGHGLVFELSP
jgi:uncharacterized repeat protein (TIGR03803 family)